MRTLRRLCEKTENAKREGKRKEENELCQLPRNFRVRLGETKVIHDGKMD